MYSALAIANYFVEKHKQDCGPIGPLKLQKLVYIAYGWCWGETRKRLFADRIEAWALGPVIPSVYYAFKHQGTHIQTAVQETDERVIKEMGRSEVDETDEKLTHILIDMYRRYNKDASVLVNLTHEPGTPWSRVYDGSPFKEIPKSLIENYYEGLYPQLKAIPLRTN